MNCSRFTEQLESFLARERRGPWCAIGMADIAGFKQFNDADGHVVGLRLGRASQRRFNVPRLATDLIKRTDRLMYQAKAACVNQGCFERVRIREGELVPMSERVRRDRVGAEPAS